MEKRLQHAGPGALSTPNLVARVITSAIRQPIFLVATGASVIGAGLYLNWPAVVALGLAPFILMLAPCALMCALGLCKMPGSKNKADGKPPAQDED